MLLFWTSELIQYNLSNALLSKEADQSEHLLTSLARNFLYTLVGYFAFQRWYLKRYSWKVSTTVGDVPRWEVGNPNDHSQVVVQSNQDRWEINLSRLTIVWDLVRMGGTLSVPYVRSVSTLSNSLVLTVHFLTRLPIALLQLPVVFGNATLRTMVILAFLLATSSLVSASFFVASKEHLLTSAVKRERWIDASICLKLFPSIDFWLCISWPVTSFVW